MKNRFYLACFRDNVGSNVSFQCKEFKGYHTDIDQAHECTLEEAQRKFNHAREYDLPLSADHVDALAVWKVDHQYLPLKSDLSPSDKYVFFVKGIWDGNDVYWTDLNGSKSTNFLHAQVIGRTAAESINHNDYVVVPFELANKSKRRTFDFRKVDKRTMVQGAGLKTPEHLKKAKRKSLNPKTRFNCPKCGKINWQHNPYDFEVCNHCYHHGDVA